MSSAFVKKQLKSARDALSSKDYAKAQEAAAYVLEYETENYTAHVFLGLAQLEQGDYGASEKSYVRATELQPKQTLAWQGLSKLYEKRESWIKFGETLVVLMDLFNNQNPQDAVKCAETLQKLITLRRSSGTRAELVSSLSLLLPTSPYHTTLSLLPVPNPTAPSDPSSTSPTYAEVQEGMYRDGGLWILLEVTRLTEVDEGERFRKEVERRRMRLGAGGREGVEREVSNEMGGVSKLPELYDEILAHPRTPDDLRSEVEQKLLRWRMNYLRSCSKKEEKARLGKEIDEMVDGIVLLDKPDELGWRVFFERADFEGGVGGERGFGKDHVRRYVLLFPREPLARVFRAFWRYIGRSLGEKEKSKEKGKDKGKSKSKDKGKGKGKGKGKTKKEEEGEKGEDDEEDDDDEDVLALEDFEEEDDIVGVIIAAHAEVEPPMILANRIMAQVYLGEEDWEGVIKMARVTLGLVDRYEREYGRVLARTKRTLKTYLGTALTHYFSPKHHVRAERVLLEAVSGGDKDKQDNALAWMSLGFVREAKGDWEGAKEAFKVVLRVDRGEDDEREGEEEGRGKSLTLRATEEIGWCLSKLGDVDGALDTLRSVYDDLKALKATSESDSSHPHLQLNSRQDDNLDVDLARSIWRIGLLTTPPSASYKSYITSLKHSPTFAPAFTSLGIFYAEHASPPDSVRSLKCWQKAVELDGREGVAARRLVEGFADEREWDLVEVVCERVVEGEGGLEGGLDVSLDDDDESRNSAGGGKGVGKKTQCLPTNAWAWKALGVVKLHERDWKGAIGYLQVALRVLGDHDESVWVRLGEAYSRAGRHVAAVKALNRALEISSSSSSSSPSKEKEDKESKETRWLAPYLLADVYHQLGSYTQSIDILLGLPPPLELGPKLLLARCWLDLGKEERKEGFGRRAGESFGRVLECATGVLRGNVGEKNHEKDKDGHAGRSVLWKLVLDALSELADSPSNTCGKEVRELERWFLPPPVLVSTAPWADVVVNPGEDIGAYAVKAAVTLLAVESFGGQGKGGRGSGSGGGKGGRGQGGVGLARAWFDLGVCLYRLFIKAKVKAKGKGSSQEGEEDKGKEEERRKKREELTKSAIEDCLKKALEFDNGYAPAWALLGHVCFVDEPRKAQHAYIRAIECSSSSPSFSSSSSASTYLPSADPLDPSIPSSLTNLPSSQSHSSGSGSGDPSSSGMKYEAEMWSFLGLLYVYHGDVQLGREVFERARVVDPECVLAWMGFVFGELALGGVAYGGAHGGGGAYGKEGGKGKKGEKEVKRILAHVVTQLKGSLREAEYLFAERIFASSEDREGMLDAFFALGRSYQVQPQSHSEVTEDNSAEQGEGEEEEDPSTLHLLSLIHERLGLYDTALLLVTRAIGILEAKYEESEDEEVERWYVLANATLGRVRLALGLSGGDGGSGGTAEEAFEVALGLVGNGEGEGGEGGGGEGEEGGEREREKRKLRVQAHMSIGLERFHRGDLEGSLSALEEAESVLTSSSLASSSPPPNSSPSLDEEEEEDKTRLAVLIAQVLWSLDTPQARDLAKERLLSSIANDPENLSIITTLGAMAILSRDDVLVDAALSELVGLDVEKRERVDPRGEVGELMERSWVLEDNLPRALSAAQKSVIAHPSGVRERLALAKMTLWTSSKDSQSRKAKEASGVLSVKMPLGSESMDGEDGEGGEGGGGGGGGKYLEAVCLGAVLDVSALVGGGKDGKEGETKRVYKEALGKAQRAIRLAPGRLVGWRTLAYLRRLGVELGLV